MTLRFQMHRDDVLAFSRQYHAASPTYRRTRMRVRLMFPVLMMILLALSASRYGFQWESALIYAGASLLWFFIYPARYDRNVRKYCEKIIDEGSHKKNFGAYELTFTDTGIHSIGPGGESRFHWSSVDRIELTDTYLFVFLNGGIGYPIPIQDVGNDAAKAAHDFIALHIENQQAPDA